MKNGMLAVALAATACIYSPKNLTSPDCLAQGQDGCDGVDNDCDEELDEDCCTDEGTFECGSSVGRCEIGERTCKDGLWSSCLGEVPSQPETCADDVDHDCDGHAGCLDMECYGHSECAAISCVPTSGPLECNSFRRLDPSQFENTLSWYSCLPWDMTGDEMIYTLTVDDLTDVDIWILDQDPHVDVDVIVLSGACDPDQCLDHGDRQSDFVAVPGQTYFVVFDSYEGRAGSFDAQVSCNVHREICANGIDDNGDTFIDCDDPSCSGEPECDDPVSCSAPPLLPCNGWRYPQQSDVLENYSDCTVSGLDGPEDIWRLHSPEGGTVDLFFDPGTTDNAQLLLPNDLCTTGGNCTVGTGGDGHETIELDPGETIHVVVDGYNGERDYSLWAICDWEDCATNEDDNDNGLINGADPSSFCYSQDDSEHCLNGVSDDADTEIDCEDSDCDSDLACPATGLCHRYSEVTCGWSDTRSTADQWQSTSVIDVYDACSVSGMKFPEHAFSFLAPGSGEITVTVDAHDGGNAPIMLLADSCAGTACIAPDVDTLTHWVEAGTTYFIVIDSDDRVFNFDIDVECDFEPCMPSWTQDSELVGGCWNEGCDDTVFCPSGECDTTEIVEIASCDYSSTNTTAEASNNLAWYSCSHDPGSQMLLTGGERIYHLSFDHDQMVSMTLTSDDAELFVLEGECHDWTCVANAGQGGYLNLRRDTDYYFVVDSTEPTSYTFTLACETQPPYDICANGIDDDDDGPIDCADPDCQPCALGECAPGSSAKMEGGPIGCGDWIVGTTANSDMAWDATDNIDDYDCEASWGALGPEKAYELVVPFDGPVTIELYSPAHLKWYVLQGECRPEACVAAYPDEQFHLMGGRLYYLVVDGVEEHAAGPFALDVQCLNE